MSGTKRGMVVTGFLAVALGLGCSSSSKRPKPPPANDDANVTVDPVADASRSTTSDTGASPMPDSAGPPTDAAADARDVSPTDAGGADATIKIADAAADAGGGSDAGPATSPLKGIGKVELVRSGFVFVEGLRWVTSLNALLVSDAWGDMIYKLTPPNKFDPFRPMSNGSNCMDIDPNGHIVVAEVGGMQEVLKGGVSRRMDDGTWVDAITQYNGLTIRSPNDIVAMPDGNIFFSDPGRGVKRLFRIDPMGGLSYPITNGMDANMNGLALSPDKKTFYAGIPTLGLLHVFDVQDGKLTFNRSIMATTDGMCIDVEGNIYATTGQGVEVWNPATGKSWGLIGLPGLQGGDRATECEFADADARTLYISAVTKLFRVRMARPGLY